MKYASVLLGIGCLAILVYEIEGFCDVKYKDKASSTCETAAGTLKVGQIVTYFSDCIEYFCNEKAYGYCGIGYKAGLSEIDGCVQEKLENCCYQFVKRNDRSIPCEDKVCPYGK
ncbi:hypothetical protein SNE40_010927 [Patella caerulea]|uniref:Uncharacterized protein n=1 Tax=Patella caerulea TaxID=87958 RepID=A0AAN8Q0S8_PATCE